jgi:peptidoglycan L-alanyl-D-glutamate endopeptidase CwlK
MKYKFSERSLRNLEECHPDLQEIFLELINHFDCAVIEGFRGEYEQNKAFFEGKSKLKYPESKHNQRPSLAIDVVPWPIDWKDRERFVYMAGMVKGIAFSNHINIRWGGDWDGDNDLFDQTFFDLPHFELILD